MEGFSVFLKIEIKQFNLRLSIFVGTQTQKIACKNRWTSFHFRFHFLNHLYYLWETKKERTEGTDQRLQSKGRRKNKIIMSSNIQGYPAHFLGPASKSFSEKFCFLKKKFFSYFGKWNFLATRLENFLYFLVSALKVFS